MSYSTQAILLAVVPKVPAVLSLLGSSYILNSVLGDRRRRRKPFHRIMLGMSCSDIAASTVYFLGTWLIPRDTVGQYGPVFLASGNDGTCNLSGFFTQFAVCSPLYNGTLSLYYLLVILFGWKEDQIIKIEPIFHLIPVLFACATAVTALALDLFGSVDWLCWINPIPPQANFRVYQWSFLFVPLWICAVFVTSVMIALYWKMRKLEKQMENYMGGQTSRRQKKRSQEIAVQGMLYVSAFYITWFFPSLQRIIEVAANRNYFVLQMFDTALLPLQGLFNVAIYIRPRVKQYRKAHPNMSWWRAVWNANDIQRASVAQMDTVYMRSNHVAGRTTNHNVAEETAAHFQVRTSQLSTESETQVGDDTVHAANETQTGFVDEEAGSPMLSETIRAGLSSEPDEDETTIAAGEDEEIGIQPKNCSTADCDQSADDKDSEGAPLRETIDSAQGSLVDQVTECSAELVTVLDEQVDPCSDTEDETLAKAIADEEMVSSPLTITAPSETVEETATAIVDEESASSLYENTRELPGILC